ncbi:MULTISPECIES: hypothetical protein [Chryseobacterium]|uniref:Uncharacterized protein n=3 Tax=Chryseobacterium TaxID=59732 RepID=A0A3M7TFD8_9FLAO|nr:MULTISPECIES: hypothetical protein [Chryseobacterium]RMZ59868.1 hypothetical protein D1632_09680 [Chryseobacterium nematophagum]RNA62225.1 hypothetical protein D1631_09910 [Chryseobacterium nematophagum]CAA7197167.1 hypothetical protein CHRY9293_03221 [Chryseobacterium potabilaquae]CAA7392533.1 hypothetical protein CHRY9393_03254 [Chryseobacterium fistulae]
MKADHYKHLLGKNKKQIIEEFGQEFNYYHSDTWSYTLNEGWFGICKVLFLFFEKNKVQKIETKKMLR